MAVATSPVLSPREEQRKGAGTQLGEIPPPSVIPPPGCRGDMAGRGCAPAVGCSFVFRADPESLGPAQDSGGTKPPLFPSPARLGLQTGDAQQDLSLCFQRMANTCRHFAQRPAVRFLELSRARCSIPWNTGKANGTPPPTHTPSSPCPSAGLEALRFQGPSV